MGKLDPSPSRTYVAICNLSNFNGKYFRKFILPKSCQTEGYEENLGAGDWVEGSFTPVNENTCARASWYFLNVLNFIACIDSCIPYEQYVDIKDQDELNAKCREELSKMFPAHEIGV